MNDIFIPVGHNKVPISGWNKPGPKTRLSLQQAHDRVLAGSLVAVIPQEIGFIVFDVDCHSDTSPITDVIGVEAASFDSKTKGVHLVFGADNLPSDLTTFPWSWPDLDLYGDLIYKSKVCICWNLPAWVDLIQTRDDHQLNDHNYLPSINASLLADFEAINKRPGIRNSTLFTTVRKTKSKKKIEAAIALARAQGLPESEIASTVASAIGYRDSEKPGREDYCDLFIGKSGEDYLFNSCSKQWLRWSGVCWVSGSEISHGIRLLIRELLPAKLRTSRYISDIQQLLADRLHQPDSVFDANDYLLNCPGVEIDLLTGKTSKNKRESRSTMLAGTHPDELMPTPRWDQFLQDFTASDQSMIDLIYKILFQSLLGNNNCQRFFILSGSAGSGKSTLTAVLKHIVGDYSIAVNTDVLQNPRAHQTATHALKDCRFGSLPELSGCLDIAKLKSMTGGDTLSARALYSDPVQFKLKITLLSSTNSLPKLGTADTGVWSRIIILPSTSRNFREEIGRVNDLEEVLFGEASGILGKTLGYRRAFESDRFFDDLPTRVTESTQEYFNDEDHFSRWLSQNILQEDTATTPLSDLFSDHQSWCFRERIDPPSLSGFGKIMLSKHRDRRKRARIDDSQVVVYSGLKLANSLEEF